METYFTNENAVEKSGNDDDRIPGDSMWSVEACGARVKSITEYVFITSFPVWVWIMVFEDASLLGGVWKPNTRTEDEEVGVMDAFSDTCQWECIVVKELKIECV